MRSLRSGLMAALALVATLSLPAWAAQSDPPERDQLERQRDQLDRQLEQAHERMEQAVREITDLSMKLSGDAVQVYGGSRAMLGINIGDASDTDPSGVRVISVSPGGPADVAGLKANDVIVSYQGKELRGDSGRSARQRLLSMIHESAPDVPVAVQYRRGDKLASAQIVPKSMSRYLDFTVPRELEGLSDLKNIGPIFARRLSGGFGSVELVDLSPGLGRYFGTDRGLLVVRAPRDERLKLQDGDVILDIDGRVPTSATHAFEILSSYRPGETLKLHIMRQQKRTELPIEMPNETERKEARAAIRLSPPDPPPPPPPPELAPHNSTEL
jgi:S1-C subfamily serine protease